MIITNRTGLPQSFVKMAESDYVQEENEYRVTQLLKGVREIILEKRHGAEVTQDVSDMIWLLLGTACHAILEYQEEQEDELKEERMKMAFGKYTLSGKFDLYNETEKCITDYKTCSVWKLNYKDYDDWHTQTLIYAYMLRSKGYAVDKAKIVTILKDHSKRKAKYDPTYPQLPTRTITFKFTEKDFAEIEKWINDKFKQIEKCEKLPDNELPICTQKERFNKGDKYAVKAKNRKTALRVLDSREEADKYLAEHGGDFIEVRKGEDTKCQDYCSICDFCDYYLSEVKQ